MESYTNTIKQDEPIEVTPMLENNAQLISGYTRISPGSGINMKVMEVTPEEGEANINNSDVINVQERAEFEYVKGLFSGHQSDGLAEATSNSTITRDILTTEMTNSTAGSWSLGLNDVLGPSAIGGNDFKFSEDLDFFAIVQADSGQVDSGALWGASEFWGLFNNGQDATPAVLGDGMSVKEHIGFYVGRDDVLYASNADNTTQKTTALTAVHTTVHNYSFKKTSTEIKFYVDDVLVATHTDNLPSTTSINPRFEGECGLNTANAIDFLVYNNYKITVR